MKKKLITGTFNAESFYNDSSLVQLPTVPDSTNTKIIQAMDELLFPLCGNNDLLLTRYSISSVQKQYLEYIGFHFLSNKTAIDDGTMTARSLHSLLIEAKEEPEIKEMITNDYEGVVYAVTHETGLFFDAFEIPNAIPDITTVIKVNSKSYSSDLHERIGIQAAGKKISTIDQLKKEAEKYSSGSFLIKHPYGVSGKGNLLITTKNIFERIVSYSEKQIQKGKKLELIIEPFMEKKLDFSCQMFIDQDGTITVLSLQKMINHGFNYGGSTTGDKHLNEFLEKRKYFDIVRNAGKKLFEDGYFGYCCIDSMILVDDTVVPILEINARMSMGLINHTLHTHLTQKGLYSTLRVASCSLKISFSYEKMIEILKEHGTLYNGDEHPGIIPLSPNTLTINTSKSGNTARTDSPAVKGRLYCAIAAKNAIDADTIFKKCREQLNECDITLHA